MKSKTSIILHICIFLFSAFIAWLLQQIKIIDLVELGSKTGIKWLSIFGVFSVLAILTLISYIFSNRTNARNNYVPGRKNVLLRTINKFKYPRYITFKNYDWVIRKDEENILYVDFLPICPNCCVQINQISDAMLGYFYKCGICNIDFSENEISIMHSTIENILSTHGLKYFTKIKKKPC